MTESLAPEQGVNFELTDDMKMLKQSVRDFAMAEVLPHVMRFDEAQEFPASIVRALGDLGVFGAVVPVEFGGTGLSPLHFVVIMEELSRVDPSIGLTLAAHSGLCTHHIAMHGSEDQKKRYLPALASGAALGSWCLTEPGSGSDASGMKTTAVKSGDSYVISGSKTFITNGSHASTFVVMAKTDMMKGNKGISAFILDRSMKGISVGKKENKLGMRASDTVTLMFDEVQVPATNLIGKEGEGFTQALVVLDSGRIGIAALSVGLAQGALDAAVKYSKERHAFGKAISEFQGIQFKLADMATEIQGARLLVYRAAMTKLRGENINQIAAQAKLFASEVAVRAANEAVQIHGGYGFIKDFPVEKFYRDAKLLTIGEGTSEVQKMVIAKNILSL